MEGLIMGTKRLGEAGLKKTWRGRVGAVNGRTLTGGEELN